MWTSQTLIQVVVFALSNNDGSAERADIEATADYFVNLWRHPDPAAAMRSWRCGAIVYLDGYIMHARPEFFSRKQSPSLQNATGHAPQTSELQSSLPIHTWEQRIQKTGGIAPLQVACMYPGTLGSPDWDYYIADRIVSPPELVAHQFTETILEMPFSYYVNDYTRSYSMVHKKNNINITEELPPSDMFRFANFNQLFKTDGPTVTIWSNLLRRNPKSLLWQLRNPAAGAANLELEFLASGGTLCNKPMSRDLVLILAYSFACGTVLC